MTSVTKERVSMDSVEAIAAIRAKATAEMMRVMGARAKEMIEREVGIGMGEVMVNGKEPDAMVQSMTLRSLRQQLMGAPTQKIESENKTLRIVATYDLPSEKVDRDTQPDRISIPETAPQVRPLPTIAPLEIAAAGHDLKAWRKDSFDAVIGNDRAEGPAPQRLDVTKIDRDLGQK
jgi:hypothetical protein